eukprot:GFUD01028379.1.p1 GENE.GFUD01028379.1~~GFUD01028379.1.p1  ORF type:complete len:226 (-),score=48.09 GFUD01028379.1:291-887(-)
MDKLITHVSAADVTDEFKDTALTWPLWESRTHPQTPAKSGKFHFDYNGDYETERVLIMSGKATLSPEDGSSPIAITKGDQVFFHKGFACNWHVTEPMTKHYAYYDEDGVEVEPNPSIACDICEAECYEESYLTKEEEDICPDCYKADKKQYVGAEHQKFGEPLKPAKAKKREAPETNGATKKAKGKKESSDEEDEDED